MRVVGRHIVPHSAYMKDRAAKEGEAFERVKTALQAAFAEPRENYHPLTLQRIRAQAMQGEWAPTAEA